MASPLPKVVIPIPCYGYARYLPDAVGSVAAQTYPEIRCIIVDPESPDDTGMVAQQLADRHPHLQLELLQQANRGLPASRNEAIQLAADADLVLPLDADDRLRPTAIETLVTALLQAPNAAVACPAGREFGSSQAAMPTPNPFHPTEQLFRNRLPYCSMFRRSVWAAVGGYDESMTRGFEDWELWIHMLSGGAQFTMVAEELFDYRKHGHSMIDDALQKDIQIRAHIIGRHSHLYSEEDRQLADRVRAMGGNPPDPGLRLQICRFYIRAAYPQAALPHAEALLQTPMLPAEAHAFVLFCKGYGHLGLGQTAQALPALRLCNELSPATPIYMRGLALALSQEGQQDQARQVLSESLRLEPNNQEALALQSSIA